MQIETENCTEDFLFLTCAMSEIRPILDKDDLTPHHGLIIFLENQKDADFLTEFFLEAEAVQCKTFSKPLKKLWNNGLGFHLYSLYDKEEKIFDFLESENFFSIVIVHGIMPDFLKRFPNIIPLGSEDLGTLQKPKILEKLKNFKMYARKNPSDIQKSLHFFKTSEVFLEQNGRASFYLSMMGVVDIFCNFFRYSHTEYETEQEKIRLRNSVEYFCNFAENYGDAWDILDTIRNFVYTYLDENQQIAIGEINKLEGALLEAVEEESAILYDANYYYFPEKILRQACSPLFHTLSFPEIKQELKNHEILHCNSTTTQNFTTKKLLTNAYGRAFRVRFLKILKEFFVSPNSLGLEERREKNCLSEILITNLAQ